MSIFPRLPKTKVAISKQKRFRFAYAHSKRSCVEYGISPSFIMPIAIGLFQSEALTVELMAGDLDKRRILNAMFRAGHEPSLISDHSGYLLTDNGLLTLAKAKKHFLTASINDQDASRDWTVGVLPIVFPPMYELSGRTAIATTKRLGLKLRETADVLLSEVSR